MSDAPITPSIIDPDINSANIADNVNDHTPDPETPPLVDALPDPPTQKDGESAIEELVKGLADRMEDMETIVRAGAEKVISGADTLPDVVETVERLPWTARKLFGGRN